jgi:hypothetical protein
MISENKKQEYFCGRGWTGQISLKALADLVFWRRLSAFVVARKPYPWRNRAYDPNCRGLMKCAVIHFSTVIVISSIELTMNVIARNKATKQSRAWTTSLDCFAALAMTLLRQTFPVTQMSFYTETSLRVEGGTNSALRQRATKWPGAAARPGSAGRPSLIMSSNALLCPSGWLNYARPKLDSFHAQSRRSVRKIRVSQDTRLQDAKGKRVHLIRCDYHGSWLI